MRDLTGLKYGKLTILSFDRRENRPQKNGKPHYLYYWFCQCECGGRTCIPSDYFKYGNTKSCGCGEYRFLKGEKHALWRFDLTKEDREFSRGKVNNPRWKAWVKRVLKRDNYKCQLSGVSGTLATHHLEAWNSNPSQRFLTSNGIAISKPLHKLFHKLYGYGDNTKKQFREFVLRYRNGEIPSPVKS